MRTPDHRGERRAGDCASIAASVASRAGRPVRREADDQAEEAVAHQPLLAQKVGPGDEPAQRLRFPRAWAEARVARRQVSRAEYRRHRGTPGERRLERVGVDQRRRLEGVARLEQDRTNCRSGKDLLEVRVAASPGRRASTSRRSPPRMGSGREHGRGGDEQRARARIADARDEREDAGEGALESGPEGHRVQAVAQGGEGAACDFIDPCDGS